MNKKIVIAALSLISFSSVTAVTVSTVAWFYSGVNISFGSDPGNVDVSGGSAASYYESGSGAYNDPYVISNKIHLYNLAWLQYIGYYNAYSSFHDSQTDILQNYFVIKNDIDMGGLVIPPIGTEKYPFLGNFNGQGHTISNFTVSNDNPALSNSDFGVARPVNLYGGVQSNVVGFFGVVGKLPNQSITYDSSIVSFTNTTLSNFAVKAETSQVLIGLAAGYINGEMNGVKVGGTATLDVDGQTSAALGGEFRNLSDYGLVGYTTKIGSDGTYQQKLSEYYSVGGDGSGEDPSWGGSINVKHYNHWFYYLSGQKGYDGSKAMSTSGNNTVTGTGYKGLFSASSIQNPELEYLFFRATDAYYVKLYENGTGVLRYNSVNYNITSWSDSKSGSVYGYKLDFASSVKIGSVTQTTFYLNHSSTSTSSNLYMYRQASHTGQTSGSTGYIENRNYTQHNTIIYRGQNGMYLPLKFNSTENANDWIDQKTNTVADNNTGYILGATGSSSTNGAVKVSSYSLNHLHNSLSDTPLDMVDICMGHGYNGLTYTDSDVEILTYKEGTGWVLINDSHNSGHTPTNTKLSTYTKNQSTTPDALFVKPKKYNKSRDTLNTEILSSSKRIHAIHFDAPASGYGIGGNNNIVSYSNAKVLNQTYASYQMPCGSIDFNLEGNGVINFFAGAYNSSDVNMSFFSLYKITRNNSNNITAINEIRKIYENPNYNGSNDEYIYSYDGNTPSGVSSSNLIKDLDNSLRISSVPVKNALYYFELPVNRGEYCMAISSATSNQGAYMMYLDIGTSGEDRDELRAHSITTITTSNPYPVGVDFIPVSVSGNGGESIAVYIPSGSKGVLAFSVTSSNIAITDSSSISTYAFQSSRFEDGDFTVSGNSPGALVSPSAGTRVLSIFLGTRSGDEYNIMITDVFSDAQGTIASSTFEVDDGSGFATSSLSAVEALSAEISVSSLRALNIAAILTRTQGTSEFVTTYDEDNSDYENKIVDVDIERNGTTISVGVTAGYTFKIGGVTYANNSTYPAS